ncbi:ATP-binding response regulator [Lichenifustis flavocetrariae]|uniref:histidine kinase n=1 Tax=Lichenifustis flavocetrariae TaxID=2949735 RepID=A0AA41Z6V7_9HYPH|nr:hybrid sensor histidine kinase/response regulator [Lichenifustis flavocetrariae]MCW6510347.1 hybrid sensor histidine kinase/response regulator [Lichenifustis flavocetrariae]
MAPEIPSLPRPEALPTERTGVEQIEAVFGTVTVGVCGAAFAAGNLAAVLCHLGVLGWRTGITWTSYIAICAVGHILLCRAYRRSRPVGDRWRLWAHLFTAICLAEGIGWGWAPIGLTVGGNSDVKHLTVLIMAGVAAGSIPAFSPYLPAFFALFLPATIPALIAALLSADPVQHASFTLVLLFILFIGGLGVKANLSFKQLVGLRIRTEEMAGDLQRQKDIAEQANKAKSTFLAAASHDLRQPVHALGLFVGALRGVALPLEGRRLVEQIEVSTNAMDSLFTALLDISRLDAGAVEVQRQPFVIGSLLDRICRDHAEDAKLKGVSLKARGCAAVVDCDPVLLERVVRNLVSNAVRYTERGRILVGCRRRQGEVLVQVWDTGPGIPPEQHDKIFQEYYQLGNSERDRAKGLGLGLAIVRRLTDLLGCRLKLQSRPGHGSCFEVSIPMASGPGWEIEPAGGDVSGAPAHGLIVVIDDEEAIRAAMQSLLTGWGYDVVAAASGDEAIRRLSTCPVQPGLLVSDYRLREGENGIDVIERLRSEYNEPLPALLITGDTAPDRLSEAQASGLLLLHKPVSNSKLRAAIINLMASADASEAAREELSVDS